MDIREAKQEPTRYSEGTVYGHATTGNNRKVHAIRAVQTHPQRAYISVCGLIIPARPQTTQASIPECKRCF